MNEILKIRNELSKIIIQNNKELTSDVVIQKSLEAELILNSIVKNN